MVLCYPVAAVPRDPEHSFVRAIGLVSVVKKVDNSIHWKNFYPRENAISFSSTNPPEGTLRAEVLSGMDFSTQKVVRVACQSRTTLLMLKAIAHVKVLFN